MALGKMSLENEGVAVRLIGTTRHNAAHIGPATNRTPHALFARPITSTLASSSAIVGYLVGIVALESYLYNLLPPNAGVEDLVIVAKNSCGDEHTFLLEEERVSTYFCHRVADRQPPDSRTCNALRDFN